MPIIGKKREGGRGQFILSILPVCIAKKFDSRFITQHSKVQRRELSMSHMIVFATTGDSGGPDDGSGVGHGRVEHGHWVHLN